MKKMSMKTGIPVFLVVMILSEPGFVARAQEVPADFKQEFLRQFEMSSRKLVALSEAIPAEKFTWSPGEGVMSIGRVYMHIARYNYYYPQNSLGIEVPEGIDLEQLESITDKERVREILQQSIEHVRSVVGELSESDLAAQTTLYGRQVPGWTVLLQLLAHMNEHVGQSIAYARMNQVVPPWSR